MKKINVQNCSPIPCCILLHVCICCASRERKNNLAYVNSVALDQHAHLLSSSYVMWYLNLHYRGQCSSRCDWMNVNVDLELDCQYMPDVFLVVHVLQLCQTDYTVPSQLVVIFVCRWSHITSAIVHKNVSGLTPV